MKKLLTTSIIFFLFSLYINLFAGQTDKRPPFDISLTDFIKPPFDISIPDDAIINIQDEIERKLTKILVNLTMENIKALAKDFDVTYPAGISKRNLIRILARNLKVTDLKARQELEDNRSRREISLQTFRSDEQKGVIIHNADEVISLERKFAGGFVRIFIFGHVEIEYQKKKFKSDLMVINIKDKRAEEIMGLGNITIQDSSMFMIADKFFYYPPTRKGVFYNPKTYMKPFYVKSEKVRIVDMDFTILNNMLASTCDLDHAHYSIKASRAFIYNRDKYVFVNVVFNIGQSPFFYTPFYVHSMYGSGIRSALAFERGMSWYIQNTYYLNLTHNSKFKFMFDYYQKLGLYSGIEATLPYTQIKLAGAYDRHIKYIKIEQFTNYFEEVPGEGPVSGRSLRGKIDLTFNHDILKFFSPTLPFTLNTRVNYKDFTDPYFSNQFEGKRVEVTDYLKILRADFSPSSFAPYKSPSEQQGRAVGYDVTFNYKRTSLSFAGDWNFRMARTTDPKYSNNPYQSEFWKHYKQSIAFPKIALNTSLEFFDIFYITGVTKTTTSSIVTPGAQDENQLRSVQDGWKYTWPFSITPRLTYSRERYYSLTDGIAKLESDIFKKNIGVTMSAPMGIEYKYKEIGLRWDMPISSTLNVQEQTTLDPTDQQVESDKQNSVNSYTLTGGFSFTFDFFKSYEYLYGKFRAGVNYSQSSKFGKNIKRTEDYQRNESINFDTEFEWLKTSVKLTFGHNYSPNIENRKGTLSVTTNCRIIPFITFSDVYTYDRDLKESLNNNMTFQLTGLENIRIINTFFIKKFNFALSWYKDFRNFKNNYMSWNYTLDFGIADHTTFSMGVRGQNKKLVAYTSEAKIAGVEGGTRDIFTDLMKSFNFFNTDHRKQSLFKVTGFNLDIVHMLHKWKLQFTFKFESTVLPDGSTSFVPSLYFVVTLADMPGFGAPPLQNRYSQHGVTSTGR